MSRKTKSKRASQAPTSPEPETQAIWRIGKYEIVRELGHGAMGQVYAARHPVMNKMVAIKVFRAGEELSAQEIQQNRRRLIDEGRRAGVLSHPHIVTVHDVDVQGDLAYMVMEFVDGPSLDAWLRKDDIVEAAAALDILRQVASALDYAHSKDIVHRDIKPANILIAEGNDAKVADFGIAKNLAEGSYTQTGIVLGTPIYMAPEQIAGKTLDGRADQFALGAIAYRMISGHRPFEADSVTELFYKIVNEEAPSPLTFVPGLHPGVEKVLTRVLAKDPQKRYPTCTEFVASLERVWGGQPAPAPMPSISTISQRIFGTILASKIAQVELKHRNALYFVGGTVSILVLGLALYAAIGLLSKLSPKPVVNAPPAPTMLHTMPAAPPQALVDTATKPTPTKTTHRLKKKTAEEGEATKAGEPVLPPILIQDTKKQTNIPSPVKKE
jgi:serine/threonine protein kinase